VSVAGKIHSGQVKNSRRKPSKFNTDKEIERILKVMLDVPKDYDVWLKEDDGFAIDEYRRKMTNVVWQGAMMGVLYLTARAAGSAKPDAAREKVSMFLVNHALGNPPTRVAVADVTESNKYFSDMRKQLLAKNEPNGEVDD
jgi:hypothetical protein